MQKKPGPVVKCHRPRLTTQPRSAPCRLRPKRLSADGSERITTRTVYQWIRESRSKQSAQTRQSCADRHAGVLHCDPDRSRQTGAGFARWYTVAIQIRNRLVVSLMHTDFLIEFTRRVDAIEAAIIAGNTTNLSRDLPTNLPNSWRHSMNAWTSISMVPIHFDYPFCRCLEPKT